MGLSVAFNLPAGSISQYAGSTAPAGWLLMFGQAISRSTYKALFDAIGTTYGAGDGSTTFNIPDARGRALFGKDNMGGSAANRLTTAGGGVNAAVLGAVGGGQSVTLTQNQAASHAHTSPVSNGAGATVQLNGVGGQAPGGSINTGTSGLSEAHGNIPPALVINYIIKA